MSGVNGTERVYYRAGQSVAAIAKAHKVAPAEITRADGSEAIGSGLMPGEVLFVHHPKPQPNQTEAILAILANSITARNDAQQAQGQLQAQQALQAKLTHAADGFNCIIRTIRDQLIQGENASCTLANRGKLFVELNNELAKAKQAVSSLDPSAQAPAMNVVDSYTERAQHLLAVYQFERGKVDGLSKTVADDAKALRTTEDTGDVGKIGPELKKLYAKYQDSAKMVKGLSGDALKTALTAIDGFQYKVDREIVRYSGSSDVDATDNGYLIGRPGPRMRDAAKKVDAFLACKSTKVSDDERSNIIDALKTMHDAIYDDDFFSSNFEDPMTKTASIAVYDSLSKRALAKLDATDQ